MTQTAAIFISYAREDAAAARRIAEALRVAGVEVWFDENELRGGDVWDAKIRRQIDGCSLFLPIISQHTQQRGKGYFRLEWKLAVEQTHLMADGIAFLAPIVIDDTREAGALVPPEFLKVQWTRLPGALPTPQFVEQVKRLLASPRQPVGEGRASTSATVTAPAPLSGVGESARAPRAPARLPLVLGGVAATLVIAGAVYFALRPGPKPEVIASPAPKVSPAAVAADKPPESQSIAVLAFADMSEARNSEYFSDGISEELLNTLAKVPGLRVAARTSAFHFKGKNLPVPDIGRALNVAYVVEGSVQRAGDRVKIGAQLIKAADGFQVWSETFTRDAKDVFAVQEEIAGRIAQELSLKLGVSSRAARAAVNPEAYELYLQGRQAWNLRTEEGYARAEELFNRALALEPDFPRALSALADVWILRATTAGTRSVAIGQFSQRDSPEIKRILAQIERALALDPNSAEAHASLGHALQQNWRLTEAARALRRAIELNPNYATAHQWLGRVLVNDAHYDEALAALRRASELDPLSPRILDNYAIILRLFGRYEEALALDERALALQPNSRQAGVWRALDLSGLGRREEALAQARRMAESGSGYERFLIEVLLKNGARAEAEALLTRIPTDDRAQRFRVFALFGRYEEAFAALDPDATRMSDLGDLFISRHFDPVRRDPRFVQLLTTLGVTDAQARADVWRASTSGSGAR